MFIRDAKVLKIYHLRKLWCGIRGIIVRIGYIIIKKCNVFVALSWFCLGFVYVLLLDDCHRVDDDLL